MLCPGQTLASELLPVAVQIRSTIATLLATEAQTYAIPEGQGTPCLQDLGVS